ncbi:MAG: ribonuclease HII [Anaerolineales bacterium]
MPGRRPDLTHELELRQLGHTLVAGLDEVGRGALAGPVIAAAVVLPLDRFDLARALEGVRDSKQLTPLARRHWAAEVRRVALSVGIGQSSARELDRIGVLAATRLAMKRALDELSTAPSFLLIDHLRLTNLDIPQRGITRGDQSVLSIAAASVIAKVARDQLMEKLGKRFPAYGFGRNKGYGTAYHRSALDRCGTCPQHRRSYAPVQLALGRPGGAKIRLHRPAQIPTWRSPISSPLEPLPSSAPQPALPSSATQS